MPRGWTRKDERQYEHIRDSEEKEGTSESRAKEIAARTVNKRRRKEGRTPNKTTQGTGNPNRRLQDRTVQELRNLASELHIEGRSKLNKDGLVRAIGRKQQSS
jgi:plasmid stabilization system protein ParE